MGLLMGDVLVDALGKEHGGRTRAVGTYAPWKTGLDKTKDCKRERKRIKKAQEYLVLKASIMEDLKETYGWEPPVPNLDLRRSSCGSRVIPTEKDALDCLVVN